MSNSTQCVKPPASGASGSCMMSTNDLALAGASFHESAGEGLVCPASHVYFDGMLPPSVNALLEIENAAAATSTPSMHASFFARRGLCFLSRFSRDPGLTIHEAAARFEIVEPWWRAER